MIETAEKMHFTCDKHGYSKDNTASFCALGCGHHYNHMIRLREVPPDEAPYTEVPLPDDPLEALFLSLHTLRFELPADVWEHHNALVEAALVEVSAPPS